MSNTTKTTLIPWNLPEPPSEVAIRRIFAAEGLAPYAWGNAPGDVYAAHEHAYHKVLYCVRGSITFGLLSGANEGRTVELRPGDRLELPPGTRHDAQVGPEGVLCLEGHR